MGLRRLQTSLPTWCQTVGSIRAVVAAGGCCRYHCTRCAVVGEVDLDRVIAARGEDFSLINRTAACREPGCPGRIRFSAGQPNTWTLILRTHPEP